MTTFSLCKTLAELHGISGREHQAAQTVCTMLRPFAPDAHCQDGSVIGHLGGKPNPTRPTLLLCAHLDRIGFFVTDITEDGFLRLGNVGGMDRRLLLGQSVHIDGAEPLFGIISILPPHLLHGEQSVPEMAELCVDTGYPSADALRGKVQRGDAVYFDVNCEPLLHNCMTGAALDDRCGVAALLCTAEQLAPIAETLPCNVTLVCSAQEERGSRGAKIIAKTEQPDYAIAVDVTFAKSHIDGGDDCYTLGGGPAIGISSVLDASLSEALIACAEQAGIPYQIEVMPDGTGTDADDLALAPDGARAATVSIPQRYMHTPVEAISTTDVEMTASLLTAYAKECGK